MVCCASAIASNIAGKISRPLRNTDPVALGRRYAENALERASKPLGRGAGHRDVEMAATG
jgi:hypothetical protein